MLVYGTSLEVISEQRLYSCFPSKLHMCSFNKFYLKWFRSDPFKVIFDFQEVRSCLTVEKLSLVLLQSLREAEAVPVPAEGFGQDHHHAWSNIGTGGLLPADNKRLLPIDKRKSYLPLHYQVVHSQHHQNIAHIGLLTNSNLWTLCWWLCAITSIPCCSLIKALDRKSVV